MEDVRIAAKGRVTDLSKGFRLPENLPFSIYVRPKERTMDCDVIVQCRLICDREVGDFPMPLGDWTPGKIAYLPPNAIDTAKYEIYWGASDNPY